MYDRCIIVRDSKGKLPSAIPWDLDSRTNYPVAIYPAVGSLLSIASIVDDGEKYSQRLEPNYISPAN